MNQANRLADAANTRANMAEKRAAGMRASELSYRRLFESAKDGILILDAETGMIVDANPFLLELLGYSHSEMLDKKVWELGLLKDIFTNEAKFRELQEKDYVRYEHLPLETAQGRRIDVEFVSNVYPVNDQKAIQCNIRDISERKALEARLSDALLSAEAGNRAKSEFLGIMSHELRTPLNGILGCSELLNCTSLDKEQKGLAETISGCGQHLLAIIKDVLDFVSIDAGALDIELAPTLVAGAVEFSANTIRPIALSKGLNFRCECIPDLPYRVLGDSLRLRQILINLLGNAVKFTRKGTVSLRVSPDASGRFLDFAIEDTGIGMTDETIALLFLPFTKVDSSTRRTFGGTGLGLAISKRLAEAMGGSISVASNFGTGSTFTLRLPLESKTPCKEWQTSAVFQVPACESNEPQHSRHRPPIQVKRTSNHPEDKLVLVVEDDPIHAIVAEKILQSLGYNTEFASDGSEAIEAVEACESRKYFAILMDVVMPVMDGIEATRQIRSLESGTHVPIIALTANAMADDRDLCIAAGMDDFISKPFNRNELAAKLDLAGNCCFSA